MWLSIIVSMAALMGSIDWKKGFESEPFEAQKNFISSSLDPSKQFVAAFSGLQGGKTLCGADALMALLYGPAPIMLPDAGKMPMEVWILSKSYSLVDTALMTFKARTPTDIWLGDKDIRKWGLKRGDSRTYILKPRSGIKDLLPIVLRARTASDPENLRATPSLGIAWCDEIAHWKELAWKNLQGRAIVARTKFLITTTPKGKNWLYRDVYTPGITGKDPKISVHTWRSIDNPYADKEYIEKLRLKFGADYAAQELDAMFTANVGYVYDFDRALHVSTLPSDNPEEYPVRVLGVDPGYGDPYAVGVWLRDSSGDWWLADEFYQTRRTTEEIIPWFRSICAKWKIQKAFVDKRRPSDRLCLQRAGIPAMANLEIHGENDRRTVMPMIRVCQQLFKQAKVHIAPHCEWFSEEAENYAFPDRDERNFGENPVDFQNHHMDAMRYAICSVEDIPQGPAQYQYNERGILAPIKGGPPRKKGSPVKVPTLAESLSYQDSEYERRERERS